MWRMRKDVVGGDLLRALCARSWQMGMWEVQIPVNWGVGAAVALKGDLDALDFFFKLGMNIERM